MALIDSVLFTQNASDLDVGVVTDASDYGVGGNPLRSATANYLLWSKTDKDGNRTFTNPDQGDVYATLQYQVSTLLDGWFEAILMRFTPYSGAANYVEQQESNGVVTQYASIVADVDGSIYKAIAPSIGQSVTDTDYFELVPTEQLYTLITNTNVDVYVQDIYVKTRTVRCTNRKFTESCGCGCNGDLSKIQPALNLRYKIVAADTAFLADNPEEMEEIIREAEEICSNC